MNESLAMILSKHNTISGIPPIYMRGGSGLTIAMSEKGCFGNECFSGFGSGI